MPTDDQLKAWMALALADALSPEERTQLDAHLAAHPGHQATFTAMHQAVETAVAYRPEMPGPAYWDAFETKLLARLAAEAPAQATGRLGWMMNLTSEAVAWLLRLQIPRRRMAMQVAFGVLLVTFGIWIGRLSQPVPAEQPGALAGLDTEVEAQAYAYLGRSKVLLLGMTHAEPSAVPTGTDRFAQERALARSLLQESPGIKAHLDQARQQRLLELVTDLEVILLQIANLEAQHNAPGIALVQSGVERKGIFLKINMAEMRRASAAAQKHVQDYEPPTL